MAYEDKSVFQCKYCGEIVGAKREYCATCSTQKGRKAIFDENVKIYKKNKELGFIIPEVLKNWK